MDCIRRAEGCAGMQVIYGDATLGVRGEGFHHIFSYAQKGLESLTFGGREWLYRPPKPTFWRAVTDNDRGNGFCLDAAMWYAADMFIRCAEIRVAVDGTEIPLPVAPENNRFVGKSNLAETVRVTYTYETVTAPSTQVEVSYTVGAGGSLRVEVHYKGRQELPELPVFGMRFLLPEPAEGYSYEGLSGETYPDRMAGGVPGVYEVSGLPVTPYLVPQDCGVHMDTKWLTVDCGAGCGLKFQGADGKFAFSCLPYTAQELESATHQEELPPARRTVVCILGAVRGVGGIDSWGSDVEKTCHIDASRDIKYAFTVSGAGRSDG